MLNPRDNTEPDVISPSVEYDASRKLILTDDDIIGVGSRRHCYVFPHESSLCVKIPKPSKNGIKQQRREVRFYEQLYRRGVSTERIPRYHGTVPTSRGTGYVYDAIRDADGKPSRLFNDFLTEQPSRKLEYLEILNQLEDYLFANRILFYDLSPWNILCQSLEDGSLKPFIIDGIGDVVVFPVLNHSKYLVYRKLLRRWFRMIRSLSNKYEWMDQYHFSHSKFDVVRSQSV
jgi:hypothetical protein